MSLSLKKNIIYKSILQIIINYNIPLVGACVAIISEVIPRAGNNTIYTSGCPKNQNKC